jgi:flagellar protein FlaG
MDVNLTQSPDMVSSNSRSVSVPETKPIEKVEGFESTKKSLVESTKENQEKNEEKLREAVDKINKAAVIFDRSLRFQVHEATHRTMVSVIDIVNDKVIRQIPEEEVLDLVAKMQDYIGLIFDKKA